ncbi:MAG: BrnA antitoxin family protein [Gammaproteobacteria bacterium]|nr:BrnA antitoxin family protein [Gammaproteobacteria bacterium]
MSAKRGGSGRTLPADRDDAPEITESWAREADLHRGEKLIRRGRPKLESPRTLLSLRLPPEVIASWKASGPGWQTRMATVLQRSQPKVRRSAG